jgi:hypothetical protein
MSIICFSAVRGRVRPGVVAFFTFPSGAYGVVFCVFSKLLLIFNVDVGGVDGVRGCCVSTSGIADVGVDDEVGVETRVCDVKGDDVERGFEVEEGVDDEAGVENEASVDDEAGEGAPDKVVDDVGVAETNVCVVKVDGVVVLLYRLEEETEVADGVDETGVVEVSVCGVNENGVVVEVCVDDEAGVVDVNVWGVNN